MGNTRVSTILAALTSAATVAAHGHVNHIVVNGVFYQGYDPTVFPYMATPPTVIGWSTSQTDNGFVEPNNFGSADIICHKNSAPGGGHVQVKAGDSISITWNTWPESHKGPMIDFLAPCNGPCESVSKESLNFFKIDEVGIVDPNGAQNGLWGSDVMIANNFTWLVQIPANIKAGNYVLRHDTIALHASGQLNGAQAYPQCFNLEVTGGGSDVPTGVPGTQLYKADDPGVLVNIYTTGLQYTIPGPALIAGASSSVLQSSSRITATGTATVGSGNGGGATTTAAASPTTTAAAPTTPTTQPQQATTTTANPVTPTTLVTSSRAAAPTTPATTPATTTAQASPTAGVGAQSLYGQCGGINWTGPTACAQGTCKNYNPYYFQCVSA
ncbi:carbohydrate-binding module family 1 protein [Durotheca rogersii]|uniref:carbohydrate-binding module family 1 protein n=1 Tax=Durotheca rogersii TaxID=419775 RepID=UPI0022206BA4|nr:carbohydrate-binding module family 1 protein [Durotheca rogersii]KAI5857438.1 carbohydrate-binding module family 1 protein [Durotheca rogersii]